MHIDIIRAAVVTSRLPIELPPDHIQDFARVLDYARVARMDGLQGAKRFHSYIDPAAGVFAWAHSPDKGDDMLVIWLDVDRKEPGTTAQDIAAVQGLFQAAGLPDGMLDEDGTTPTDVLTCVAPRVWGAANTIDVAVESGAKPPWHIQEEGFPGVICTCPDLRMVEIERHREWEYPHIATLPAR